MDAKHLMHTMPSIPPSPIGTPEKLRADLVEQILAFQSRYVFQGPRHTREALEERPTPWLERLCNMQLLGIAMGAAPDRLLTGRQN